MDENEVLEEMKYPAHSTVPVETTSIGRMKVSGKRKGDLRGRIFIFLVFLLTTAFGYSSVASREIFDMAGRRVNIPDTIRSVYGCSPPGTFILYAITPDLVAGLNFPLNPAQKKYLPATLEGLPVIGGWFGQGQTPNLETLLSVKPDIAVASSWDGSGLDRKIEKSLSTLGIPVVYIRLDSMEDYSKTLRFLGALLGREERGAELADYTTRILEEVGRVREAIPVSERVTVYYAEGEDGLQTECDNSIHAELIALCGGKNVHVCDSRSRTGMEKVSLEQVLYYAPQAIVTHSAVFFEGIDSNARWRSVPAVHGHNIYRIPTLPFNWFDRPPSFMRFLGAKWLLQKLYPDRCTVDMAADTRAFFKLFLNASLGDDEVQELLTP